jgi:hypothetical protein
MRLARDRGATVHEAAAAAAAAQRMITQHRLNTAELDEERGEQEHVLVGHDDPDWNRRIWRAHILNALSWTNGCMTYRLKSQLFLVGRPADCATVRYLFELFTREIETLCDAWARKRRRPPGRDGRHAFKAGAAHALEERIVAAHHQEIEAARNRAHAGVRGSVSLVRIDQVVAELDRQRELANDVIRAKLQALGFDPGVVPKEPRPSPFSDAFFAGRRAGERIALRRGRVEGIIRDRQEPALPADTADGATR